MQLEQLHHRLIVSCQALADEPLHGALIMSRMALAAAQGGAAGIRANSVADIKAIKQQVNLPVIGIIKQDYADSEVYITPTLVEVEALLGQTSAEIIAVDATNRPRSGNAALTSLLARIHEAGRLAMADIATYAEGVNASQLGFDLISTTMSGYTADTPARTTPDLELVQRLSRAVTTPVIMEGHTWQPEQVAAAFEAGAFAAVVGGAITRPQQITAHYVDYLAQHYEPVSD